MFTSWIRHFVWVLSMPNTKSYRHITGSTIYIVINCIKFRNTIINLICINNCWPVRSLPISFSSLVCSCFICKALKEQRLTFIFKTILIIHERKPWLPQDQFLVVPPYSKSKFLIFAIRISFHCLRYFLEFLPLLGPLGLIGTYLILLMVYF